MGTKILLFLLCVVVSTFAAVYHHPLEDYVIETINARQTYWKAGRNFNRYTSIAVLRRMSGVKLSTIDERLPEQNPPSVPIPHEYDAREAYPNCPSIGQIRDQGTCAGWAFAAVESITDRICIHSNNSLQFEVSVEDPTSCCGSFCGDGCNGGWRAVTWKYWVKYGIVSGGPYHSHQGCYPSEIMPCGVPPHHPLPKHCRYPQLTPPCKKRCEASYPKTWKQDKHFGVKAYSIAKNVEAIQQEIYKNGPVEAVMTAHADIFHYKRGVYRHTYGSFMGYLVIRILGWGTENGQDYWLAANSWSEYWGDQGFIKILRGVNECGIEQSISAGLPREQFIE